MSKIIDEIIEKYIDTETPLGRRYICAEDVYQIIKEVLEELYEDEREYGNTIEKVSLQRYHEFLDIKIKELFEE